MASETTLITGASSGIGMHLAHEFARNGHPLVLVAPVREEIEQVSRETASRFGVDVQAIACDLEREDAVDRLAAELGGRDIHILVNNAGHGQRGNFWEIPLERHLSIIRLNCEAVIRTTQHFLPPMLARGAGRILNVASIAGFEPGPLLAVYHASKAFVLSFSEALAEELEDSDVSVTTLCPGPTDTDFFPKADMERTRAFQQGNLMAPQDVAQAGYEATMRRDRLVVPGGMNKAMVFMRRLMPESMQAGFNEKLYEEVPADQLKRSRGDLENASDRHGRH